MPEAKYQSGEKAEQGESSGVLKIFFSYAGGIGKTYAMLEAAHRAKASSVDAVIGFVDTHGWR